MATIDEALQAQIVIAASTVAGPGAPEVAVAAEVRKIINRLGPGSLAKAEFEKEERRDENTEKVKTFKGTITYVDKEISSTRALVFMKTEPSKWHPDGKENFRTDRTDTTEGRDVAILAQGLLGHQVLVHVAVELMPSGTKVRVLRNIQDLGIDPAFDANNPDFQPSFEKVDQAKLAGRAAALGLVAA